MLVLVPVYSLSEYHGPPGLLHSPKVEVVPVSAGQSLAAVPLVRPGRVVDESSGLVESRS